MPGPVPPVRSDGKSHDEESELEEGSRVQEEVGEHSQGLEGHLQRRRRRPPQELVAEEAYYIWERRGGDHGHHEDDWLEAERVVREKLGL